MKTKEEVGDLKSNWYHNPCWDIEDTEGFNEHKEELLSYRLKIEKQWKDVYDLKILKQSIQIGVGGDIKLTEYLMNLEK